MSHPGLLLIDYGDLPSLVAVTLQTRPEEVVIFHPRGSDAAASGREAAARQHKERLGARGFVLDESDAQDDGCVLWTAAAVAVRQGCPAILWPRQVGPDPDLIGQAVLRANLVADFVQVGAPGQAARKLVIDLPLVDLTDARLVELAEDGGAPMRAFGPCDSGRAVEPCGKCDGCRRWHEAFDAAGVVWPWATVSI
jgi:hypothetical protein